MNAKITKSAVILPERKVSSAELEERLGLEKGFIESHTGIKERRVFSPEYEVGNLYSALFDEITGQGERIDSVVLGTDFVERESEIPEDLLQGRIGDGVPKSYISNCSGSVSAIIRAAREIDEGNAENSLILSVSRLYDLVSEKDIGSSILWGDGAGGILLEGVDDGSGIIHSKEHKDLSLNYLEIITEGEKYCKMDGRGVTKYVLGHMPTMINQCLDEAYMKISDIDYFILHQANGRMLGKLIRKLNIPEEKVPINVDIYGNTGVASPLISYHQLKESGKLKPGKHYLIAAFGLGDDGKGMQSDVAVFRE